jgi:zinc protease
MQAILLAGLVCALSVAAQEAAPPSLTADQIIEKSIEASGGRKAMQGMTSMWGRVHVENSMQNMHGDIEYYTKAPNKRLVVVRIEDLGELRQGFDGVNGWVSMGEQGVGDMNAEQLAAFKREAAFNPMLNWRELYPKAKLRGKEMVGDREAYAIEMTAADGKTEVHYYDAETFLLVRQQGVRETPQGPQRITLDYQDYRDVSGLKMPFLMKQTMAAGGAISRTEEMKVNVPIDDAMFTKPWPLAGPAPAPAQKPAAPQDSHVH